MNAARPARPEPRLRLPGRWQSVRRLAPAAFALLVLLSLVRWGGIPERGPAFALGVAVLSGLILAFGLLTWWLYLSPMPQAPLHPVTARPASRQLVASLVLISGLLLIIGGAWDEVWHRRYGGFGDDFLWPPHLLLYLSLGMIALFAAGGLLLAVRRSGSIRERFRSEPALGLLGLVAAYLVASLPSDELWHIIYGRDLTAWSLPHLFIAGGFTLVMLVAVTLQLSVVPGHAWQRLRGLRGPELLALLLVACATVALLQVGATEWEGIRVIGEGSGGIRAPFWQRPEWLYPVVVASVALFSASFALHALRRAGAATTVALFVLAFRLLSVALFQASSPEVGLGFVSHLLLLPPAVALDLWYARHLRSAGETRTVAAGTLVAALVFLAAGLPIIARLLLYPRITLGTVPAMLLMVPPMALVAGWAGARLGAWLGDLDRPAGATVPSSPQAARLALGALGLAVLFVLFFILTARPPLA